MDNLWHGIKELSDRYTRISNKYLDVLSILTEIAEKYPYILKEVVTEEQLDEILGDE